MITPRHLLHLARWSLIAATLCVGLVAEAVEWQLVGPRAANAFYTGEPVQFSVVVGGPRQRVRYTVTDVRGTALRSGLLAVGLGRAVQLAVPGALPTGYYELKLPLKDGLAADSFCVIPPPWADPGDYRLFSLHPDDWGADSLRAAAQIGVRTVRHNILWPNTEPRPDEWDQDYLTRGYDWARDSGLQMLVVLGYTPQHQAERAENCHGWVEQAAFTWHPREANAYARYADRVMSCAQGKTLQWPAPGIVPEGCSVPQETVPWVSGWEVWNEADLVFYFGDWNRYGDMLHLSYATSRQRTPDADVVYGGSTGNFCAMGMLFGGSLRYCYDYDCFHPDGEVTEELGRYYSGAQQIPYCAGVPRETLHTESYSTGRLVTGRMEDYRETPGDLLRLYVTLKAWREVAYFRSGCNGGWVDDGTRPCPGTALLVRRNGQLSPTPLYPAFAATRQLLSEATLVGPVDLGENATGYAFLKHGRTMLAAWSDRGATARFFLQRGAYRVDAFGRRFPLGDRATYGCRLTAEPTILIGAKDSLYLPQALRRRYALFANSYYGVPPWSECLVWYVHTLGADLGHCADGGAPLRLLRAVRQAAKALGSDAEGAPAALGQVQDTCGDLLQQMGAACVNAGRVDYLTGSTMWRLARVSEWLGEVADARSALWNNHTLTPAEYDDLAARREQVQARRETAWQGAALPQGDQYLRRTREALAREATRRGRGSCLAVRQELDLAEQLEPAEQPLQLQVVPLLEFASGHLMRKAWLLDPGQTHTLRLWVSNYLNHAVSGQLHLTTPDPWQPRDLTVPFTAEAFSASTPVEVQVSLPADPTPWRRVDSFTLDGALPLELPPTLSDRPELRLGGTLSDGTLLPERPYFTNVGRWVDGPADVASQAPAVLPQVLERARRDLQACLPR